MANELRNYITGLNSDNSDNSHTGDTNETALASYAMPANTMGATGSLHIIAAGTTTGANDTKTMRLDFGATTLATVALASGASTDWAFDAWISNTATGAQRVIVRFFEGTATLEGVDYITAAIDTTASVTIRVSGQLGGASDTITQTMFSVFLFHTA